MMIYFQLLKLYLGLKISFGFASAVDRMMSITCALFARCAATFVRESSGEGVEVLNLFWKKADLA